MTLRNSSVAVAVAVVLFTSRAAANPIHVTQPFRIVADTFNREHPPGYVLTEPDWNKLDREIRRLQEAEIRLLAENKALTESPPCGLVCKVSLGVALVIGGALVYRFD